METLAIIFIVKVIGRFSIQMASRTVYFIRRFSLTSILRVVKVYGMKSDVTLSNSYLIVHLSRSRSHITIFAGDFEHPLIF